MQTRETDRGVERLLESLGRWHPQTRAHSERVADVAAHLATLAGWSADGVAALRPAALLHDIGKLRVPVEILDKPGPLDAREMRVVRRHVWFSVSMARRVLSTRQILWISGHHERPDASGYPLGLAGSGIPEGAALLALADVWDVMTNNRPYCRAHTDAEALAECTALAGRQFTVQAVQALHAAHALHGLGLELVA
jgi:putative nucleotidyltransferase with HDIG domain